MWWKSSNLCNQRDVTVTQESEVPVILSSLCTFISLRTEYASAFYGSGEIPPLLTGVLRHLTSASTFTASEVIQDHIRYNIHSCILMGDICEVLQFSECNTEVTEPKYLSAASCHSKNSKGLKAYYKVRAEFQKASYSDCKVIFSSH